MKAVIIGAGIGGLTTAIALEQKGVEVEVYERAAKLEALGAGISLWSNAIHVFDALGMGEALLKLSFQGGQGAIRDSGGGILTAASFNEQDVESSISSVIVHRAELHDLLIEHFHGQVHLGRSITGYAQSASGVTVHFADGGQAQADVLIASDGIHSAARLHMHPQSKPVYSGYTAYRGVVSFHHSRMGGVWGESWGCGSRFGIAPLSDNRIYWFGTENAPEGQRYESPEALKAHLQTLFTGWHDPISKLIAETPAAAILHHDIHDLEPVSRWVDGRTVLLGDAAHAMTPNLGQGACQAIEDAYALAHYLTSESRIEAALEQYQALRQPRTQSIMQQSRQIGAVGQIGSPALCWLRNQAIKFAPKGLRERSVNAVVGYDIALALSNG